MISVLNWWDRSLEWGGGRGLCAHWTESVVNNHRGREGGWLGMWTLDIEDPSVWSRGSPNVLWNSVVLEDFDGLSDASGVPWVDRCDELGWLPASKLSGSWCGSAWQWMSSQIHFCGRPVSPTFLFPARRMAWRKIWKGMHQLRSFQIRREREGNECLLWRFK